MNNNVTFTPFKSQPPTNSPFAEGDIGYILNVVYSNKLLGYLAIRPKNFISGSNKKNALELYDTNWSLVWRIAYDT